MQPTAIITGATSGIGKAYATALAKQRDKHRLTGRREAVLKKVALDLHHQYGAHITVCLVDFSNTLHVSRFLKYIARQPAPDFLINNAVLGAEKAFTADHLQAQLDMLAVHNTVTVQLCHLVGQQMKQAHKGTIINVSSLAGELVLPDSAMYCATKIGRAHV